MRKATLATLTTILFAFTTCALAGYSWQVPYTIKAEQVKFEPKLFDLSNPELVIVHVKFPEPYERNITDVDPSTVLLEGCIPPLNTSTTYAPPEFIAEFDGYMVANALWGKIYHMGITTPKPWVPTKVELQISGKLVDGTDWHGIGKIKIVIPETSTP